MGGMASKLSVQCTAIRLVLRIKSLARIKMQKSISPCSLHWRICTWTCFFWTCLYLLSVAFFAGDVDQIHGPPQAPNDRICNQIWHSQPGWANSHIPTKTSQNYTHITSYYLPNHIFPIGSRLHLPANLHQASSCCVSGGIATSIIPCDTSWVEKHS